VRLVVYAHPMPARDDVVDWVRGTLLTDFQKRLPPELWDRYLATYRARLVAALPDERPFLYTYKRILFWGSR
jgi:trans-aconitate 2-methyltransferase